MKPGHRARAHAVSAVAAGGQAAGGPASIPQTIGPGARRAPPACRKSPTALLWFLPPLQASPIFVRRSLIDTFERRGQSPQSPVAARPGPRPRVVGRLARGQPGALPIASPGANDAQPHG
ncbi:Hypothetical protein bglu_2g20310 [Burkholderia glumae BGR1]|nr:Hypothetical protein bglu_2g20310 [Burkholderia glumae BGR1]